jgi:hypothetical protein
MFTLYKSVYFWKSTVNLCFKLLKHWIAGNQWDVLSGLLIGYLPWQVEEHGYKPMHVLLFL